MLGHGIEVTAGTLSGAALFTGSGQDGDSVHDRTRTGDGRLEVRFNGRKTKSQ